MHALQTQVDVERKARVDCEEGLQRQKVTLIENHNLLLNSIRQELVMSTKAALKHLTEKFKSLRKKRFGYQCQVKHRRDLSRLSQKGGHGNAQKRSVSTVVGIVLVRTQ